LCGWPYRIWRPWRRSRIPEAQVITDGRSDVAEIIGSNLFIFYSVTTRRSRNAGARFENGLEVFRRILDEAIALLGSPEDRAARIREREERLRAEAERNPVVIERWSASHGMRERAVAIAGEFREAFGGKQVVIHDYSDDAMRAHPSGDGRLHIYLWSSPVDVRAGKSFARDMTLFGKTLRVRDHTTILAPSGSSVGAELIVDELGGGARLQEAVQGAERIVLPVGGGLVDLVDHDDRVRVVAVDQRVEDLARPGVEIGRAHV